MLRELKIGPLNSLVVPDSWLREDSYARGTRIKFIEGNGSETSFVVLYESRSISEPALAYFRALMQALPDLHSRRLNAAEIVSIREVLGSSSVGDNQYTNKRKYPDPRSPAFDLASAHVVELGGKNVLDLKGAFIDSDGTPSNYVRSIFAEADMGQMLKLFLQTPSQNEFIASSRIFNKIVSTINWQ